MAGSLYRYHHGWERFNKALKACTGREETPVEHKVNSHTKRNVHSLQRHQMEKWKDIQELVEAIGENHNPLSVNFVVDQHGQPVIEVEIN